MSSKVLVGLLILSILGNVYLFSQMQSQSSTADEAMTLSTTLEAYFEAIDYRCSAQRGDLGGINTCITELISERTGLDTIERTGFENVYERDSESGYLIVENTGSQSLNSSAFTLLKNKVVADDSCQIDGTIDTGYTCRLDFSSPCEPGDVLEVQYGGEKALLETC